MQTGFAAIAAPVRLSAPVYQTKCLCSFVDVALKAVEVFGPLCACGKELSSTRTTRVLAAIQLFTKLLQPSCGRHACRNSRLRERFLRDESGLLTNCQQARYRQDFASTPQMPKMVDGQEEVVLAVVMSGISRNQWSHQPQQPEPPGLRRD